MLNPSLSKIQIQFSAEMFPSEIVGKYNDLFRAQNQPLKTIDKILIESIKNVTVPGLTIPSLEIANLPNLGSNFDNDLKFFPHSTMVRTYEGNEPWFNVIESKQVTITFRNYIYNWTYLYEMMYRRFQRRDRTEQFSIIITVQDAADIPVVRLMFRNCYIEQLPALEFSFDSAFGETKTFDAGFRFNNFDLEMCIPEFDMRKHDLR